jgi:hypothetical protein
VVDGERMSEWFIVFSPAKYKIPIGNHGDILYKYIPVYIFPICQSFCHAFHFLINFPELRFTEEHEQLSMSDLIAHVKS